jgi:uncharacterized oxidoreductase
MPVLTHPQLIDLATRILQGAGVTPADARIVGHELADANLVGHDSHGVMRLVQYVQMIDEGHVKLGAAPQILKEAASYALIDGGFNFGQIIMTKALDMGIEKARETGTSTVLIRNCNHVGRLGAYTERAAKAGFLATMCVNAPGPGGVAPFGGIERRLGTNPISMSAPLGDTAVVLDMTTSATAEGKLRVSYQKGEQVPAGLIIDSEGNPTTDPGVFYNAPVGSILPLGGPMMGHKGFGMSVMIDIFCGILSGSGIGRTDLPRGANGVWLSLMSVEHFLPRDEYDAWMARYATHIKSSRTAPGVSEILLPGEIEARRATQRAAEGVSIPDETWRQINELAGKLKVSLVGL